MSEPYQTEPPSKEHQPLFNRTYLKYLVFIVAIAIIFLSEKAPEPLQQPQAPDGAMSKLQVLHVEDLDQQRLILSFLSAPTLTKADRLARANSYAALRDNAANLGQVHQVLWTQDRLEIELRWDEQQQIQVSSLLRQLFSQARRGASEQQQAIIKAEDYLQNKAIDEQLINRLKNAIANQYLTSPDLPSTQSTPATALLITPLDIQDKQVLALDSQLTDLNTQTKISFPDTLAWRSKQQTEQLVSTDFKILIASQLSTNSNQQNRLELLTNFVLSELLNKQLAPQKLRFRLIRQPIYQQGYQLILLSSASEISAHRLSQIKQQLVGANIDEALKDIKSNLADKYQALTEDNERLFKLYSKKHFYGLTTESSSEYNAQLDNITPEQISALINKLFSELTFIIRLQPS